MAAGRVIVGDAKAPRARRERKAVMALVRNSRRHLPTPTHRSLTPAPLSRAQTESAARRISELLEGKDATAVRVGIKARGCNGLSYTMNYATEKAKLEEEVEAHGVRVLVEARAVMHIVGTTMDYVEDDLTSEFVFHNPNAEAACGCGESFTVAKNPEAEGGASAAAEGG